MSVSLYYTAKRPQAITLQEQVACQEIAARYDAQYPFGELYEGFCIYDLETCRGGDEADVILSGSTKLPPEGDAEELFCIINWWLQCLGEITDNLPGAQWHVHIDDTDLPWSEEVHYLFPVEEMDR